jgi:organic radical activating enzyme
MAGCEVWRNRDEAARAIFVSGGQRLKCDWCVSAHVFSVRAIRTILSFQEFLTADELRWTQIKNTDTDSAMMLIL